MLFFNRNREKKGILINVGNSSPEAKELESLNIPDVSLNVRQ